MFPTRWQTFGGTLSELSQFQDEMNRLFRRFGVREGDQRAGSYPAIDIWQDDDNLYVETEVPGLKLDDLEIYVNGRDQLSLRGNRVAEKVDGGTWHRRERIHGQFSRGIALPNPVDASQVDASLKDGILTITLPKLAETKSRRITVKVK
jgi:HSP20 family protein